MATLEKAWHASLNVTRFPTSAIDLTRNQLWTIKAFLKGETGGATQGLWACLGSSDGVTAALDGTDRWGAAYNGAKILRAPAGTAHSWLVLKSPLVAGSYWYLIIDFASSSDANARFIFSKAAPTGGTTLNRPTATDEFTNFKAVATGTPLNASSTLQHRYHMALSDEGDFWFASGQAGSGFCNFGLIGTWLADGPADEQYSLWMLASYYNAVPGAFTSGSLNQSLTGLSATGACNSMQLPDGTGVKAAPILMPSLNSGSDGANGGSYLFTTDARAYFGYDAKHFTYLDLPAQVLSVDESNLIAYGYRGRLVDFALGRAAQGTVEPPGGPYTSCQIGALWLPIDGSVAPNFP